MTWGNFQFGWHKGYVRKETQRDMVSGVVSQALHAAMKARAAETGIAMYKMRDAMSIGASTYQNLGRFNPIARTTAQKIATYLGLSLREVLTKYHQEKK